jgi:hypothetical protein
MGPTFVYFLCPVLVMGVDNADGRSILDLGRVVLRIPKVCVVKKASPVEDFDLVTVRKKDRLLLTIYIGNHPDYPLIQTNSRGLEVMHSSLRDVDIVSAWDGDRLQQKEMKIRLGDNGWPMFVHIFTSPDLTRAETAMAEKIMGTIRVRNGPK